jgi:hypothetical protein
VLSHDYVGPPLPHRGPHGRQHRAHVKRREHLSHDQPLGVVGGQGPDTRPQSPEFIFWRGAPDPEWVTGALHRVGERRRPAPRPVGARGGIIPSRHSLREASRSGPCLVRVAGCGSCLPRLGAPGISVRWCPLSRLSPGRPRGAGGAGSRATRGGRALRSLCVAAGGTQRYGRSDSPQERAAARIGIRSSLRRYGDMAEAKQVVERHVEAFNGRRTDAEPWTEDAEFVAPGASMRGREEVLAFLGALWEAFPDGRLELCGSSARARSPRLRGGSLARTAACSVRPLAKSRRPVGSSTSAGCPPTRLAATSSPRSIWSSIKWSSSPSSASCSSVPGRRSHDRAGVPTQGTPVASPPAISTGFERRSRWHRRGHVKRSARRLNTLPQQLGGLLSALK